MNAEAQYALALATSKAMRQAIAYLDGAAMDWRDIATFCPLVLLACENMNVAVEARALLARQAGP